IALVSLGSMMDITVNVYYKLIKAGYSPTIINARFASPIDTDMVKDLAENYKYIFTLEDNIYSGGFGCLLSQRLAEEPKKNFVLKNFAFSDLYIEHGRKDILFKKYGMDAESIYKNIIDIIEG
ncbi:MAG: transketolase C-terminal domain-containing protein, partial [Lachnospirales bacterium]